MRGLTAEERRLLVVLNHRRGATGPSGKEMSDGEYEICERLRESGRCKAVPAQDDIGPLTWWRITPAGREALALDAALRAMGVAI